MDFLVLRFVERLTAVLLGGMAIYLGFLLFRLVPKQRLPLRQHSPAVQLGGNMERYLHAALLTGLVALPAAEHVSWKGGERGHPRALHPGAGARLPPRATGQGGP